MPSANGQNKACLCGRRAYKAKWGWCCERCDEIEKKMRMYVKKKDNQVRPDNENTYENLYPERYV